MATRYWKVLASGGNSCHGGTYTWSLPRQLDDGSWEPGEWSEEITGELKPCKIGYHVCRDEDLLAWLGEEIYECEVGGSVVECEGKVVVGRVRLLRKARWGIKEAISFAADCAGRVLHFYENKYPEDRRPREAIEAARKVAAEMVEAKP